MMGKVADDRSFSSPTDSLDRIKKKKRRKDLEDIRQNALAIKRQLVSFFKIMFLCFTLRSVKRPNISRKHALIYFF